MFIIKELLVQTDYVNFQRLDVSGCFSFFVAMIRLSAHDGGAFFFVVHIITAVSPWQDYPQAYNVGTVGSQRCGPTSTAEDGIPADGSLGERRKL